jgi:hypothetical protein
MVFQQRNGRIERYGQEKQPIIIYLPTESRNSKIRGDQRILQLLSEKDEQAQKNIGDPSAFLGVYDQVQEELETGKAIEKSVSRDDFERQMKQTAKAADLLTIPMGAAPPPKGETAPSRQRKSVSLYASDLEYLAAGLAADERIQFHVENERQMLNITLPGDLQRTLCKSHPGNCSSPFWRRLPGRIRRFQNGRGGRTSTNMNVQSSCVSCPPEWSSRALCIPFLASGSGHRV